MACAFIPLGNVNLSELASMMFFNESKAEKVTVLVGIHPGKLTWNPKWSFGR